MKYDRIPNSLFIKNRKKLASLMKPGSIAVFHSNDESPKTGDAFHRFRQNADIFYLTGVDQEDTALILFPDAPNPAHREMLFIKRTNETIARWDGHRLTAQEAHEVSGISNIYWYDEFDGASHAPILMAENIYLNLNENDRFLSRVPYNGLRLAHALRDRYPAHTLLRSAPLMAKLRTVKEEEEIELLRRAIDITRRGFLRVLKYVKPGVWEYEIEAELIHEFIRNRGNGHAFDPIIASGASANVLHYIENNRQCQDGDMILLDFGADYANYNGDLSRTIPVNGVYTPRQREVYNGVLHVQKEAMKLLKPGITLNDWFVATGEVMTEVLVNLGLLKMDDVKKQNPANPLYKKYFMHGVGHHLGIDVHDIMNRWAPLEVGNVITVEPGIYIEEENIGVRIENDVLITANGIVDLMAEIPSEADEIESLMK